MTWIHLRLGIIAILCAAVYLMGGIAAPAIALACEGIAEEEKKEEEMEGLKGKLVEVNPGVLGIKVGKVGEESIKYEGGLKFSGVLELKYGGPFVEENPANNKCGLPIESGKTCNVAAKCTGKAGETGEVEVKSQRKTVKPVKKQLKCE